MSVRTDGGKGKQIEPYYFLRLLVAAILESEDGKIRVKASTLDKVGEGYRLVKTIDADSYVELKCLPPEHTEVYVIDKDYSVPTGGAIETTPSFMEMLGKVRSSHQDNHTLFELEQKQRRAAAIRGSRKREPMSMEREPGPFRKEGEE